MWICIDGHERNTQTSWEQTRAIAFNVMRFGNSDPKKAPKSPLRMWPFPWDENPVGSDAKSIMAFHEEQEKRLAVKRAKYEAEKKAKQTKN